MVESTMDNGSIIKWKDTVLSPGQMAESTLDNIKTIKNMDKEHLNGLMVETIQVNGKMENNMEKEFILKKANKEKVTGRWARESIGSRKIKNIEYYYNKTKQFYQNILNDLNY